VYVKAISHLDWLGSERNRTLRSFIVVVGISGVDNLRLIGLRGRQ